MAPLENTANNEVFNCNEFHDEKVAESSEDFWTQTEKMLQQLEEEMSTGSDVKLIKEDDSEDRLTLQFELCGLAPDDVKVSMTQSNFLEVERVFKNEENSNEDKSLIWAFPIGKGYKNGDLQFEFAENSKLTVTLPKDPDFKPEEEPDEGQDEEQEESWFPCLFPESQVAEEEIPVQVIAPIEVEVSEDEAGYRVEMKIDQFEVDEISMNLTDRRLLRVEGEKKKSENEKSEQAENKISRKSFGRMFWIPEACNADAIEASAASEDSRLSLKILIPKLKTGLEQGSGEDKGTKSISIKKI